MTTEIAINTPAEMAAAYGKSCRFERYLVAGSADHNGYRYENIIPWNTSESVWITEESIIRAEHIKLAEQGYIRSLALITPPPPRRPLSSLTETECAEAYRRAFTNRQYEYTEYDADDVTVLRGKDGTDLWLYDDGHVLAQNGAYSREFRAAPLVRYLDSIGIEIG